MVGIVTRRSRPRSLTVDEFETYIEARPRRLGCWRYGAPVRYEMLAWLNAEPLVRVAELAKEEVGPEVAGAVLNSAHHNQVGISAAWIVDLMGGPGRDGSASHEERQALFNVAGQYWQLRNALVEVRVGVRGFESDGPVVRLPFLGDRDLDAVDRIFDMLPMLETIDAPRVAPSEALVGWAARAGLTTPFTVAPDWVRTGFRRLAAATLASYDTYLPPDEKIAGFAMVDFGRFWEVLLAWGTQMQIATRHGSQHPPTVTPLLERADLIAYLASEADVGASAIDAMVETLTLNSERCPDGALTPFVPVDGRLVPMSSIIVPSAPQRNLLANVQSNPSMVGDAGRILGRAGERATFETLKRMSEEVLLATRVEVQRGNGDAAGDLDVVVCDPASRAMAIFEIKWHLAVDGNAEFFRAASQAALKRAQVIRLRGELSSGAATVRWPADWPDVAGYTQRWFVLTRDVLPLQNVDDEEVTIRSLRLLQRTLRAGATLADLMKALDHPPVPPAELTATEWDWFRYGDLRVEVETVLA